MALSGTGLVGATAIATVTFASFSLAAGPFDGNWTGTAISYSNMRSTACKGTVTARAENNAVTGTMQSATALWHVSGTIADSGIFTGKVDQFGLTGKFSANLFTGSFVGTSECGLEQIFLSHSDFPG